MRLVFLPDSWVMITESFCGFCVDVFYFMVPIGYPIWYSIFWNTKFSCLNKDTGFKCKHDLFHIESYLLLLTVLLFESYSP